MQHIGYTFIEFALHLRNNGEFVLSDSDAQLLKDIAFSSEPSSGYARSLYRLLTGIFLSIDQPSIEDIKSAQQVAFRSASEFSSPSYYPNPANDVLSVQNDPNAPMQSIEIFAMDGKLVYSDYAVSKTTIIDIDVLSLLNGVYLLKIGRDNGEPSINKISIQH